MSIKKPFGVGAALIASIFGGVLVAASSATGAQELYKERYRPQFHFTPERNWTNDPNGLVFFDGEYHLFYQYNPFGDKWGHMSWGHAVSRDLVHWQHLPVALHEQDGVMIFSGSAVVDWHNTSGFGVDGKPPMVAIYTGHYTTKPLQNQQIAYSNDRGRTWTKYAKNPVLDIGERDFRDPKVFWHEQSKQWVMVVAWPTHRMVRLYASPNLKEWKHLSDFGPAGATQGVWECPDLFPLSLDGKQKWVLTVNVSGGAPAGGSGCQYFVGNFDGSHFVLDPASAQSQPAGDAPHWADYGPDCYAAVSWNDIPQADGRRLWLGWMTDVTYAGDTPTSPWRGSMTIPRELSLRATANGARLVQAPARELQSLRQTAHHFAGGTIDEANAWLKQNVTRTEPIELIASFDPITSGTQGIALFKEAMQETLVGIDRDKRRVYIDRKHSGNVAFHKKFAGAYSAPLADASHARVSLHIFVDASSVEVFVNGGQQVLTVQVFPSEPGGGVEVFGPNSGQHLTGLDVWPLTSIWK